MAGEDDVGNLTEIVAFQIAGRRQHDIGKAHHGRPPRILDDDRFRLLESLDDAVRVLVVRELVAAGDVDELDVGIGEDLILVGQLLAGIKPGIHEGGDREDRLHRVLARREARHFRHLRGRLAVIGIVQAEGDAAAGLADFAEHGRKRE
ncbi:hypothetical protein [Breoghania sp.]|uniref:hypothetical protein n=1 Tax=Breoghania sp. TaxID=2065378 RepID=UPI00262213C4|nr:hypothetical protein [Breoghania sp.]MDJ0932833.1 hypothetical protein [Breoghania sp.]